MQDNKFGGRMQAAIYYLLGVGLLTIYGGQVCPFVESLAVYVWATVLAASFVLVFALRVFLERTVVLNAPLARRGRRQFWFDFLLYTGGGAMVTLANHFAFAFPLESGLKVLLGCSSFGFFMGLDTALCRERAAVLAGDFSAGPFRQTLPFCSMTRKFSLAASTATVFAALVVLLVMIKDFSLLLSTGQHLDYMDLILGVAVEIGFVGSVFLALTLKVIWSYSRNMKLLFELQTGVLASVGADDLERKVPVVTDDEFGSVAEHTNTMIDGLREKRRIRNVLGKVVDSRVADRLLGEEGEPTLGGARRELSILVSDVRGFTTRTEHTQPERLVGDLNTYFTRMVAIVREHGGLVDKFIGDGMLAVFGLDATDCSCKDAVHAAKDMHAALEELNQSFDEPMRIGVGIHRGQVIAGLVGSPERLEFTVIGDAVNTAARLESLTKTVGVDIAISDSVHANLPEEEQAEWTDLGSHALKGKAEKMPVCGWKYTKP